jgi:hypothetical protein
MTQATAPLSLQCIVDRFLANKPKDAQAWERYTEAAQEVSDAGSFEQIFATGMTDRQFAS